MADVDHPKTHVENQDVELPRTQPESPKHEGIDPLTESDTMYPAEETKTDSEKLTKKENDTLPENDASDPANQVPDEELSDDVNDGVPQASTADTQADDGKRADSAEDNVNADGKLPDDAKVANHVGSDRGNTSPSNKPATVNEPTDPDESASVTADKTTKAEGAKDPAPKTDESVAPKKEGLGEVDEAKATGKASK